MEKFVINLDSCMDRMDCFDDTYTRWKATHYEELSQDVFDRMISYHNIDPKQHKAKCGCLMSHLRLWGHIIENKLNKVIVVEDDAEQVNHLPEDLGDDFTYLGGYFTKQMTKGDVEPPPMNTGLNDIPDNHKVLMTLSYYIPTWKVAEELFNQITSCKRYRAIDVMLNKIDITRKVYYPAIYIERPYQSTIRKSKSKHPTEYYTLSSKKDIFKVAIPSYNRYDKLKQYTLAYLCKHGIPKKDIFIFVRSDDPELEKYQSLSEYNLVLTKPQLCGEAHNSITEYFKKGEYIVEIDDDLKLLIDNERRPILSLDATVRRVIDKLKEVGANYAGVYQCDNNMFMSQCKEYTTDLRYMLGIFRVRCICKDIRVQSNYAEDFEFCCAYYKRDGCILKCNHLAGKTKIYSKGGNDASGRDIETEKKDKELVASLYPDYTKVFQRKNGRYDLRLKHKK